MKKDAGIDIKLKSISITNYKGIDSFSMDFPAPRLLSDPHIVVMGSENGLGKTSIMECCAILLTGLRVNAQAVLIQNASFASDLCDLLIRAGTEDAKLTGTFLWREKLYTIEVRITRDGGMIIERSEWIRPFLDHTFADFSDIGRLIQRFCGFSPDPVFERAFLFFHSYRKVQEGNAALSLMLPTSQDLRHGMPTHTQERPLSAFKLLLLRLLMARANLFEYSEDESLFDGAIDKLNDLLQFYAGGTISKLRPSENNTVDFRVTPSHGGASMTFDGLSSGQKEIIATLFLVWYHTRTSPAIVFIDEPELHLNAQWHRSFVQQLVKLAPQNQYILATHSEDVMASVDEECRVLLVRDNNNDNDKGKAGRL